MDKHQWFGAFQRASMRCVEAEKLLAEIVDYFATDPCYDLNRDAMVDRARRFLDRYMVPCPDCGGRGLRLDEAKVATGCARCGCSGKVRGDDWPSVCDLCGEPQP